ncbi:MAG: glycosyltransferase family A protein [Ardenticatenaceae bacterium]|nr:glycosyltransferase family A protein [Ardenticatenaceae bacterium]
MYPNEIELSEKPLIDIIIPTRNTGGLIKKTVESITRSNLSRFAVWIVDQSDDQATQKVVQEMIDRDSRLHYVWLEEVGSNIARNLGAQLGHAPIIAFTDDDCCVAPDWLDQIAAELQDPDIWAVFGRVLRDEEELHQADPEIQHLAHVLPVAIKESLDREVFGSNRFDLGFGHGANMAFRREHFQQIKGFDACLGIGGRFRSWPERDIGYRILHRGGKIVYSPGMLVLHNHWRKWQRLQKSFKNYGYGAGAAAAKYLRCGDWGGAYLLMEWVLDQGVRQMISGAVKWRSWHKFRVGTFQVIYPWLGFYRGLNHPVDRQNMIYIERNPINHR